MSKNLNKINVNLQFNADTGKAKAQVKDLQDQLNKLIYTTKKSNGLGINDDLEKSVALAAELQSHLNAATNEKTGNLDFSKLNESLKRSGKNLEEYGDSLRKMGKDGYRAFQLLTNSIVASEIPIRRANGALNELWVTMKNTMRWQLTSSAMHGFMGAISSAYGYAQNLNESLNNIRIVSGKNTEEMAKFAFEANKAAKVLSATTTDYTNAALIYYQQGLSDSEIKKRTDITIKMANVTRDSAEVVSDQLTAVWNNFYKEGEKGLQHYADVMTALGAATASSTDEIAGGLEKFSSIADMIGLSFEYAASALATITATTRQSEEVVGTALKTIFARIQGLKLGETLEDGTDLNKYSDSLKRVGIEIFDTTGELKDMDDILNEIGARWDQLAKSEQVALAQAVAGIRQYNQLVSLMDNWDYFQENLQVANTSEGALDEQARIYAESWEAARDRVRTSLEAIYSDLLKDDLFIEALNSISKVLDLIDDFIDSIGGLQGVLTTLGAVLTRVFKDQISSSLKNAAYSASMMTASGRERLQDEKRRYINNAAQFSENKEYDTLVDKARAESLKKQLELQDQILAKSSQMSEEELETNKTLIQRTQILGEQKIEKAEELQNAIDQRKDLNFSARVAMTKKNNTLNDKKKKKNSIIFEKELQNLYDVIPTMNNFKGSMEQIKNLDDFNLRLEKIKEKTNNIKNTEFQKYISSLKQADLEGKDLENTLGEIFGRLEAIRDHSAEKLQTTVPKENAEIVTELVQAIYEVEEITEEYNDTVQQEEEAIQHVNDTIEGSIGIRKTWADHIVTAASGMMSLVSAVNSFRGAWDSLNNPDLSTWEKFESITMGLSTGLLMLVSTLQTVNIQTAKNTIAQGIHNLALKTGVLTTTDQTGTLIFQNQQLAINTAEWNANTAAILKNVITSLLKMWPIALGVGAGITGIAIAIHQAIKAWDEWYATTPEGKLKATKEAADEAETAFNDVATAINEVKDSIDGLESSYDKIANLTRGTLEWHQAVSDVNAEILNLINKYPELSNSLQIDEDGILSIPKDKLKELEKQLIGDLTSARNISLVAQQEVDRAQQVVDRQDYKTFGTIYTSKAEAPYAKQEILDQNGNVLTEVDNNLTDEILQAAEQIYARPDIGAQLFTDEYLETWAKELGVNSEALKELIYANEKLIIEMSAMTDSIEAQDEVLLRNRLNDYGSNMSYEEALGLTGKESYADYVDTFKGQVKLTETDYKDYAESIGAEFEEVKDGRLYYKKEGQEKSDSIDISVLEGIKAEGLASKALYQKIAEKAKDNVSALGLEGSKNLSDESYIRLDNLQRNIGNLFESSIGTNANAEFDRIMSRLEGASDAEKSSILVEEKAKLQERFGTQQGIDDNGDYIQEDIINFSGFEGAGIGHFDYSSIYKDLLEGYTKEAEQKAGEYQKAFQSALELDNENIDEEKLNEKLGSWENIERSAENLRIIDAAVKEFNTDLQTGVDSSDKFVYTMDKLATQAQLNDMTSSFKEAGKAFGLNDEESKEMQDYAKYLSEISEESEDLSDNLATDAEASADVAIQVTRMNKGVKTLAEGFSDWNDVLRKSSKESKEYSDALNKTRSALSDVLNVEEDFIENDFVEEHLDDIKLAAEGNGDAIDRLKLALADDIILNITGKEKFEELETGLQSAITNMKNILDNTELKVGDPGSAEFIAACQEVVKQAGMTAEQAQAYFSQMGFEAKFVTKQEPIKKTGRGTVTVTEPFGGQTIKMPDGSEMEIPAGYQTKTYPGEPYEYVDYIDVPALTTDGNVPQIESMTVTAPGSFNDFSSSNSGGGNVGGGSKSKAKQTKRSDVVDRYKEITDQLDDVGDAASDASKEMDRLYGANRLKVMEKQNSLLLKERDLLKQKRSEAEAYLKIDKLALQNEAKKAGVNLQFGADGNIINYTQEMNKLADQLEALQKAGGDYPDEYQQKAIDELNTKIEDLKKAIGLYDGTRKIIQDLDNQIQDKFNEWQDNNYNQLTYELELKVEINDMKLEELDYYLNKFSDNFYKMAESAALLFSNDGSVNQVDTYTQKLTDQAIVNANGELIGGWDAKLTEQYKNKDISQADYIDGLKNSREAILDNLNSLVELDKQMLHYYEDTLAAASEELADHTDHLEHMTSVFDHYLNLMDLLGKKKNYDAIGNFLFGKAENVRDRLDVAKDYYNMLLTQKRDVEFKLREAEREGNKEAVELYREEWDAIVDATDEAQEQVLGLTEEWASAMKEVISNNMTKIADTLEKTLTNSLGFEQLMDGFDKLNTRQEEYLTKTNQIYETNKLMRTASQALDETDNTVAKQKLKNFIEETKGLQRNTKLSQYELEIQQAKYDLLLAEIALEEAQNAKSTIRMSRDNEGNFGYVYTADQDAIDDAQQGVEDAENRLYNISLEGQQEYTQKYLQAQQEMYDELTALQQAYLDGDIATQEEYERRKEEILNHYLNPDNGILTTYSNLYNVAVRTDADATADYWAKDYAQMTQNTEDWNKAVNDYLKEVEEETETWRDISEQANRDVKGALDNSASATNRLTNESERLANMVQRKIVPALDEELDHVRDVTSAYADQRTELMALIDKYQEYLKLQGKEIEAASSYTSGTDYAAEIIRGALSGKGMQELQPLAVARANKLEHEQGIDYQEAYRDTMLFIADVLNQINDDDTKKKLEETYKVGGQWGNDTYDKITKMATGGYTGAWGPEGKLAMLHEKELVLNQDDTDNLLKTVNFVRELVGLIDTQAHTASLLNMSAISNVHSSGQTLDQNVSIHAEFPNATDRYEIEEAFNSLVNKASQYANRK